MRNARHLLAILLVTVFVAGCGGATRADRLVYGDVTVDGEVLPAPEESGDPAVGMVAPTLSGEDFDGQRVEMIPGDGESLLVFVAHWCPECRHQLADLSSWLEEEGSGGAGIPTLVVVTGTRRSADGYPPAAWYEETGAEAAVLVDDEEGTAASAFGAEGLPFLVTLDENGRVAEREEGPLGEGRLAEMAATAAS